LNILLSAGERDDQLQTQASHGLKYAGEVDGESKVVATRIVREEASYPVVTLVVWRHLVTFVDSTATLWSKAGRPRQRFGRAKRTERQGLHARSPVECLTSNVVAAILLPRRRSLISIVVCPVLACTAAAVSVAGWTFVDLVVTMPRYVVPMVGTTLLCLSLGSVAGAEQAVAKPALSAAPGAVAPPVSLPKGYVIGPEDVLSVVFWREKDLSADVVVRPDGKISLPVLNDLPAAGYTPQELAEVVERAAGKFIVGADATVIVKEIHSRKVFVVGEVGKPGAFPLASDMTVLQLIAEAGGLLEHANKKDIVVVRTENGRETRFKFNYNDVLKGKKPAQNLTLQPGDTLLVR
jgi:polysaccharide biosynthesis/export protein